MQLRILRDAAGDVLRGRWPKSYAFTFVAEMGVLLGGIVTLKVAGDLLGPMGFGEYAVARRAVSVLTFPLLLGLGVSIPRYLSLAIAADSSDATASRYVLSGTLIGLPVLMTFSLIAASERGSFARLLYGDARFAYLTMPIVVVIAGLYAHTLVYSTFRGRLRMWPANVLQLCNVGATPPVAVLLSHGSAAAALRITGAVWLATSVALAAWEARSRPLGAAPWRDVSKATGELLRFGLPRVAGEFALFGLFALPTFFVAHSAGVEGAGLFSFGLSLVQLLSAPFAAVGVLLLPYVSRQVGASNWQRIADVVAKSVAGSLLLTTIVVAALHACLGWLIPFIMGPAFAPAVAPARWLITGAIPYVVYTLLRDPLDAVAVWPHNAINLVIALASVTALLWLGRALVSPAAAVAVGLVLLGTLTVLTWRRALRKARAGQRPQLSRVPGDPEFGL